MWVNSPWAAAVPLAGGSQPNFDVLGCQKVKQYLPTDCELTPPKKLEFTHTIHEKERGSSVYKRIFHFEKGFIIDFTQSATE